MTSEFDRPSGGNVDLYDFYATVEEALAEEYALKAHTEPEKADYIRRLSDDFVDAMLLDPEYEEQAGPHRESFKQAIFRLKFDFATEISPKSAPDSPKVYETVDNGVLIETMVDLLTLYDDDWTLVIHELSLLAKSMQSLPGLVNGTEGTPFSDPNLQYAYLYRMVLSHGSISGKINPPKPY